jgi:hypothetical protein
MKYIIIVHVYDEENSQAYPLGGVFNTEKAARDYMHEHIEEVKSNHWTKDRVDGKDYYEESWIPTVFYARDMYSGQSLEVELHSMQEMND